MTIFKVLKKETVKKSLHRLLLAAMLHSSLIAPCQNMFAGFMNLKEPLRYTGEYRMTSNTANNQVIEMPAGNPATYLRKNNSGNNVLANKAAFTPAVKLARVSLNADILNGHIGTTKEKPSDNAKDNLFKFDFKQDQVAISNAKAYLVYEINGVESANRSINDRFATGGYMVKYHNGWTQKKELIDFNWLKSGENKVMFSVPKNANYGYEVRNVKLEIEQSQDGMALPMLVLDNEDVKYVKDNKVYVKGFLPQGINQARVFADDEPLLVHDGEFEGYISLTKEMKKRGFVVIKAYDSKGLLGQELFTTDNLIEADGQFSIEHKTFDKADKFNAQSNANLSFEGASIHVKPGALESEKFISIKKLRTVDVAPLSPGMINVTKGARGYRFLPDGTKFASNVELALEYDEQLIPKGYSARDVKTFYFDTRSKSWTAVKRDTIIEEKKIVKSSTNHFTDYINGIIQTPESPETTAFTSTMMNDIKAADPSAEMTLISPPEVSQKGDANVSYPIKIPAGRKGMQPGFAIQYSSDGGNGWLGEGWNLSTPAITLDTRWGTPKFDPVNESEIYSLGGEQLMYPQQDNKDWMPNRHFDVGQDGTYTTDPRARITNAIFTPRKQGSFAKIERLGNNPTDYYWKITGTDGSVSWYGGKSNGVVDNAVIKNDAGNIVHWALYMTEDVHGNNVIYDYTTTEFQGLEGDHVNLNFGKGFYLNAAYYTGYNGSQGDYKVQFFNDAAIVRKDVKINSRLGYKEVLPYRLNRIEVSYQGAVIRSYNMVYADGVFYKTLLKRIEELDSTGNIFYDHKFDYYNDIPNGSKGGILFDAPYDVAIPSLNTNFTLGAGNLLNASRINAQESIEMEWGVTPMAGLELFRVTNKENRHLTFGFPFGESSKYEKGKITLNDIDGNGLDDIIYKTNSGLRFLPHYINTNNEHYFDQPKDILNVNQFQVSKGWTKTMFGESFEFNRGKFSAGRKRLKSSDKTITYFTDGNGDGLPDLVVDNKVYFNHINSSGNVVYETSSATSPNMVITASAAEVTPEGVEDENPETVSGTTYDVVRIWQASRSGGITIEDTFTFQSTEGNTLTYSIETDGNLKVANSLPYRIFLKQFNQSVTAENILLQYPQTTTVPPLGYEGDHLYVLAGQRIYFRLHKNKTGKNDVLISNPKVKYVVMSNGIPENLVDENNLDIRNSSYSEGFMLSDDQPVQISQNGNVNISWAGVTASNLTDNVTFRIIKIKGKQAGNYDEEIVYEKFCPQGSTTVVSPSTNDLAYDVGNISVTEVTDEMEVGFKFEVKSDSNVRWKDIEWKPVLSHTPQGASTAVVSYPVPDYDVYEVLSHRLNLDLRLPNCTYPYYDSTNGGDYTSESQNTFPTAGVQTFSVFPNTHILNTGSSNYLSASDNGDFLFVVKKDGLVAGKIKVLIANGQIKLSSVQSMPLPVFSGDLSDPNLVLPKIAVQYVINGEANLKVFRKFTNSVDMNTYNSNTPHDDICEGNAILAAGTCTINAQGVVTPPILRNVTNYKRFYGAVLVKRGMFGPMYRNWGQFLYNAALDNDTSTPEDSYGKLINTRLIEDMYGNVTNSIMGGIGSDVNDCADSSDPEACFEGQMDGTLGMPLDPNVNEDNVDTTVDTLFSNPNLSSLQNTQTAVVIMKSSKKIINGTTDFDEKWTGFHNAQFSSRTAMQNGDIFDAILLNPAVTSDSETQILQADLKTGMNSLTKEHRNVSKSYSLSKSFTQNGGGSFGVSKSNSSYSTTVTDFVDLNGDRYPDLFSTRKVQETNMTGGHKAAISHISEVTEANSFNKGISGSKQYLTSGTEDPDAEDEDNAQGNPAARFNVSVNATLAGSNKEHVYWVDLNGDGLPDKVKKKDNVYKYLLNKGGVFNMNSIEEFKNLGTTESKPSPLSATVSFPLTGFEGSFDFSLNAGMSASSGDSESAFHDVNGDGLVDMVVTSNGLSYVRYNQGNGFSAAVDAMEAITGYKTNRNTSASLSGRAGFFRGFPICCTLWPRLINLKFGVVFSGNINLTVSDVQKSLRDFNGDGFVDYVVRNGDNFKVYPSNIRRTNKLKTVTNPLGGSFTMDYKPQKTDYKNPHAKWAMTSVEVFDGYNKDNDGVDKYRTEFAYENGNYDRRERDFYGYEKVFVKDVKLNEDPNIAPVVYRTSVSKYHNTNYFLSGLLKESYVIKGNDENLKYSKTENFYEIKQLANGNQEMVPGSNLPVTYDVGGTEGRRSAAVVMVKTKNYVYELNDTLLLTTEATMDYDLKGRVTDYVNNGNINDANDDYVSKIVYHSIPALTAKNIISLPASIRVLVNGVEKRKRTTTIDNSNGNVLSVTAKISSAANAVTDMTYDVYGNLKTIEFPKNSNPTPQRMKYTYSYDTAQYKYVKGISDSFGMSSSAVYDPKFDKVLETKDRNGNTMFYTYDSFGRNITIKAPKETAAGKPYTIKFEYYPKPDDLAAIGIYPPGSSFVPVAVTKHYDVLRPTNDIETISFIDGLGRAIQVKKDIALTSLSRNQSVIVTETLSISGTTQYDDYGRVVFQHHPTSETKSSTGKYLFSQYLSNYKAETKYDELDRVVKTIDPDGNIATNEYSIANVATNVPAMKIKSIVAQTASVNIITETYKDAAGKVMATKNEGPNGDIWTKFNYNAIGELLSYTDGEQISTSYEYDLLGRKTRLNHPDNGTTRYTYDEAGNLTELQTANLFGDTSIPNANDRFVKYKYNYNRLEEVTYPATASGANISNVTYLYGTATDPDAAKWGRLLKVTDGTGTQEYEYGNMGEVVKNVRKVVGPNLPTRYFTTKYNYDSWNRLMSVTYPDQEDVLYSYDLGGNLNKMTGTVNGLDYNYIERIEYDTYEQRKLIKYGNGTESSYAYTPSMRRLDYLTVTSGSGSNILENGYKYDKVGNVTFVENTAGAVSNTYGGAYTFSYKYDKLNRLAEAHGNFVGDIVQKEYGNDYQADFGLWMGYNNTHGIVSKSQIHNRNDDTQMENSYEGDYAYYSGTHRVKTIDGNYGTIDTYTYDLNGNIKEKSDGMAATQYLWDESNRLRVVSNDQTMQHSIYDASGERVLKASSNVTSVYQNGTPVNSGSVTFTGYTTYPSGLIVIDAQGVITKHYYAGSQRVVSRVSENFANEFEENPCGNCKDAEGKGTSDEDIQKTQMQDLQERLDKAKLGKAQFVKAEPVKTEAQISENAKGDIGVVDFPKGGGGPVLVTPMYYYHPDHLGTATYVTDAYGEAYEFFLNLPFGETMVQQRGMDDFQNRYKFTGKELDEETGLYYFGARYYDPKASVWLSVDPLAEKYPGWNPYNYTMQNPINLIDPTGMSSEDPGKGWLGRAWSTVKGWFSSDSDYKPIPNKVAGKSSVDVGEPTIEFIPDGATWTVGNKVYTKVHATTIIVDDLVTGKSNYSLILPQDRGSWGESGSDGMIWVGCMACHGDNGALRYIAYNSTERKAGLVGAMVLEAILPIPSPINLPSGNTTMLRNVDDVMENPNLLSGKSLEDVQSLLGNTNNWINDRMRRSSRADGWILREMNGTGTDFTGRMIQYHPGTPRHFNGGAYWKVSSGNGTFRIPLNP